MKKSVIVIALFYFSISAFSQNSFSEKIKQNCLEMSEAIKIKNFNLILDYTYPKIIELGGGRKNIYDQIEKSFEQMEKDGFYFESIALGSPGKTYIAGNELHCIIPEEITVKSPKGKFKATYYLLAISKDNGEKWYFIETHKFNEENLNLILPNFNKELIIPKNTKPILID